MSTRLARGGRLIDRAKPMHFTFDGKRMTGFAGDTLASAALANDQMLVGRSFKYHRPRGIVASGAEEPNALVGLGTGFIHIVVIGAGGRNCGLVERHVFGKKHLGKIGHGFEFHS